MTARFRNSFCCISLLGLAIACSSDPPSGAVSAGGSSGTASSGSAGSSTGTAGGGNAASAGSNAAAGSGTSDNGGNTSGGSGASGACMRPVGACTAPTVTVTDVDLGVAVTGYASQADTAPLPLAIAAIPSGGSRLAWLGTDKKVYIGKLGCDDELSGAPFSIPAEDLQDIYADDAGGAVLVVRNATNAGTDNCGGGTLCGGTSAQCQGTWLVRFDDTGKVQWETQVTNLSDARAGYDDGAIFTWKQYQHHGRIAFDGSNYAAYFAAAITVYRTGNSGCIDIHEGDRMQVVDSSGKLVSGHNSFDWGCSHSWTTRLAWDATTKSFVMTCATDADNCAIERPSPRALLFQATCSGQFFNGDLIDAGNGSFWSAWSDINAIHLNQFASSDNAKGPAIANAGASQHPHLVSYGPGKMLLAWGSGQTIAAQVRDLTSGEVIGTQLSLKARDHAFQAFKPAADGSAVYPAAGDTATSVKIARVLPCK
ncbi:MAG TPA: hypothetical protein VHB79_10605 [Polyangiaceae bacterium]|nr:hypothetical protein [Polyangiaceae bacterium]